jgi:hypothetical protein
MVPVKPLVVDVGVTVRVWFDELDEDPFAFGEVEFCELVLVFG